MAKATLTFGIDLSALDKALLNIDRKSQSLSDTLSKTLQDATKSMQNGIEAIKKSTNLIDMTKATDEVNKLSQKIKKVSKVKLQLDIEEAKKNLYDLKEVAIGAFMGFKTLQNPLNKAMDFEVGINNLTKFVDFSSNEELKKFENFALNKSAELGENVGEIIAVAVGGAQTGYSGNELEKYTDMISQMKVAFEISADEAREMANAWKANFGLSLDKLRETGDVVNYLDNKMDDVSAKDIGNIMLRSAGSGDLLGLANSYVAAFASVAAALKIRNEVAGTSLTNFYNSLSQFQDPASKASKALNKVGLSSVKFTKALKEDAGLAVEGLLKDLSKLDKDKRSLVLSSLLGSGEDYNTMIKFTGKGIGLLEKAMSLSRSDEANGAMKIEADKKLSTTQSALDRLKQTFNKISIQIGQVLLPPFNMLLKGFSAIIGKISTMIDAYPELAKNITYAVVGFISLTSVLASLKVAKALTIFTGLKLKEMLSFFPFECLKYSIGMKGCVSANLGLAGSMEALKLKSALFFASLKKAPFNLIKNSLAMLTNPIGIVLTLLSVAALMIYKNLDKVKAFFSGFFDGLKPGIDMLKNAFKPLMPICEAIGNFIATLFTQNEATKESLNVWQAVGKVVGEIFSVIAGMVAVLIESIGNLISLLLYIPELLTEAWKGVKSFLSGGNIFSKIKDFFSGMSMDVFANATNPQTTKGTMQPIYDKVATNSTNTDNSKMQDNKIINITMNNSSATPQAVAEEIKKNSYSFGD
ncbi:phage tail tape measure protein [Campylobacter sputorum]|uniref:phage tail tape measure protein n=1 Tax=Campylobacter sputorum TaxID=206 RepID=UPI00053BE5F7|nr:phage tail tape measure protein [Campylobacter sputorum]